MVPKGLNNLLVKRKARESPVVCFENCIIKLNQR